MMGKGGGNPTLIKICRKFLQLDANLLNRPVGKHFLKEWSENWSEFQHVLGKSSSTTDCKRAYRIISPLFLLMENRIDMFCPSSSTTYAVHVSGYCYW